MTNLLVIVLSWAAAIGLACMCTVNQPVRRQEFVSAVSLVLGAVTALYLITLLPD